MAPEPVYIGLGANIGPAAQTLGEAMVAIDALPNTSLVARSSLYASAPVDAPGPDFVNAVVQIETALEPLALLHHLQDIERAMGRQRTYCHAPRTLDLDLLLYGQREMHTPELTLPHPRLHLRAFVLLPLLELAPDLQQAQHGRLAECSAAISGQAIMRLA